jgi:hypothetical protein
MKLASIIIGVALIGATLLSEAQEYSNYGRGEVGRVEHVQRDMYIGAFLRDQVVSLNPTIPYLQPYQVARVDSIQVSLTDSGRGSLALMADGFIQNTIYNLRPMTVIYPQSLIEIRSSSQSLGLQVNGKIYIDRITVNFTILSQDYPQPGPGPGQGGYGEFTVDQNVNQSFGNFSSMNIAQMTNLYQYRGYRVLGVNVRIRSLDTSRILRLTLLANGQQQDDQRLNPSGYDQLVQMLMRSAGVIGQDVNDLVVLLDGSSYVEQVSVRLAR